MEFNLNAVMEKEMKNFTTNVVKEAVKALSVEYGFKAEEALEKMNLEEVRMRVGVKVEKNKKAKEETPSIPLPFTGQIKEGWCQAIKQNHGLYSQCNNTAVTEGDVVLCKACNNQKEKKGKPTCGYIQERMEGPLMEYKDDKGKQVVTYGVVLKKLQIERADAEAEAMKYGIMIPEDQYEIPEKTKGRPKKEQDEADKKRGRPKKEKKVVSGSAADDLVAKLISEANKAKSANAADTLLASLVAEAQAVKNVVTVEAIPLAVGGKGAAPPEESEAIPLAVGDKGAVPPEEKAAIPLAVGGKGAVPSEEKAAIPLAVGDKGAVPPEEKAAIPLAVGGKGAVPSEEKAAIPLAVGGKGAVPPEEKAAKKAQQEKEKAEKKAQQEEEKVAKKAQQEQEKKEKKAQQDAEKAVLKAQQEQEKKEKAEQAKIAKKAQQEQEKADKKAAAKGAAPPEKEKADKKAAPPKKTPEKAAPEPTPELEHEAEEDEKENSLEGAAPPEEATISVKKFEFEGQVYLRSSDDVLYNIETQEPVGMWNEDDKCIDEIEVEED